MALALGLSLVVGCKGEPDEPPGSVFGGEVAPLAPLLTGCAVMDRTPAGRWCQSVEKAIGRCGHFLSICPVGEDCTVASALECVDRRAVERVAGSEASGWFYRHLSAAGWSTHVRSNKATEGATTVEVEIRNPERAPWARWLPGSDPPGQSLLSHRDALVHLRYRPAGGLSISSDIDAKSLADRLFSLKSDLFTAAVLSGDVELTIYLPDGRQLLPPVVLAVDYKLQQPAIAAMEGFIDDLRRRYPLSRVDFELAGYSGACLSNLRVMPDLEPCYVATDDALLIGWNPASLELALAPDTRSTPTGGNRLEISVGRFVEADRRLAAAHGRTETPPAVYPWSVVDVVGRRTPGVVRFEVKLEGEENR